MKRHNGLRLLEGKTVSQSLRLHRGLLEAMDLAQVLSMDSKTIYKLASRGTLPSIRIGAMVRFDPQAVAAWLEEKAA